VFVRSLWQCGHLVRLAPHRSAAVGQRARPQALSHRLTGTRNQTRLTYKPSGISSRSRTPQWLILRRRPSAAPLLAPEGGADPFDKSTRVIAAQRFDVLGQSHEIYALGTQPTPERTSKWLSKISWRWALKSLSGFVLQSFWPGDIAVMRGQRVTRPPISPH
jgi:hypothetical protein